jgi:hypothetical protein
VQERLNSSIAFLGSLEERDEASLARRSAVGRKELHHASSYGSLMFSDLLVSFVRVGGAKCY